MTEFFAEGRPRQPNGRPTWLGQAQAVLPHLLLDPLPDGQWGIAIMRTEGLVGQWVLGRFAETEMATVLAAWRADPEGTLKSLFHSDPPREGAKAGAPVKSAPQVTEMTLEDFDS